MRQILITGANGQLGSYLAGEYHKLGYGLILHYHNKQQRLQKLAELPEVRMFSCDLRDLNKLQDCLQGLDTSPDTLIHCAAVRSSDALPLHETNPEFFAEVLMTNLLSAYNVLRATLPFMQEKHFGRVVVMGSDVTKSGLKNGSAYAASKAGVVNLVKSAAQELAADNVLLNAVSPAPVDTNLSEDYSGEYLAFRREYFAQYQSQVPSGKLVTKEEIMQVTELLISDRLTNLTGQEIFLRGGM